MTDGARADTDQADSESRSARPLRRRIWPALRVIISVALLAAVFSQVDIGPGIELLRRARVEFIVLTILVGIVGRFFAAFRWHLLLRAMDRQVSYLSLVRLTFIGMFLSFMPAGTIALEIGRVYGLNRETSDLASSFASVFVERLLGLAALMVLALAGLALAPPGVPPILGRLAWLGFGLLALGSVALMSERLRGIPRRLLSAFGLDAVRGRLDNVYRCLDEMSDRPGLLAWSALAALLNTTFRILPAFLLAHALGIAVTIIQLWIIVPIIVLAAQIPIAVGGLGVREVGFVALLGVIGVPASEAVALSLLLVATLLAVSLPGAWFYARYGLAAPGK